MHGLDRVENFVRIVSVERLVDVGEGPVFAGDVFFLVAAVAMVWFVMAIAVMSAVAVVAMVAWLVMARVTTVMTAMPVGGGRIAWLMVAVTAVTTESVWSAESVGTVAVSVVAMRVRIERLAELGVLRKLEASIGRAMCMDFTVVAVSAGARVGGLLVGRRNVLLLQRKASGAKPSFE